MSEILQIIEFICITMNGIIMATDTVYLGQLSLLDILVSIMYLDITLWGIFTLISYKKEAASIN